MKKNKLIALITFLAIPVFLFAHAPSDITIKHKTENDKHILEITVDHSVRNVERHYIETITISLNGEEYKVLEYTSQSSDDYHEAKAEISELKQGDIVEVSADCSRLGSRTRVLEIE